jgi:hypothetical protein
MTLIGWDDSRDGAEERDRWHRRRSAVLFWRMLRRYVHDKPDSIRSASNLRAAVRLLDPGQRYAASAAANLILSALEETTPSRVGKARASEGE